MYSIVCSLVIEQRNFMLLVIPQPHIGNVFHFTTVWQLTRHKVGIFGGVYLPTNDPTRCKLSSVATAFLSL